MADESFFKVTKDVTVTAWGTADKDGKRNDCYWNIAKNQLGEGASAKEIAELAEELQAYQVEKGKVEASKGDVLENGQQVLIPLEQQMEEVQGQADQLMQDYTTKQNELTQLQGELPDLNSAVSDAKGVYESKTKAYQDAQANSSKSADDSDKGGDTGAVDSARSAMQDAKEAYMKAVEAQKKKQEEIKAKQDEVTEAEGDLTKAREELKSLKSEYDEEDKEMQDKLTEIDGQLERITKDEEVTQEKLDAAKTEQEKEALKAKQAAQEQNEEDSTYKKAEKTAEEDQNAAKGLGFTYDDKGNIKDPDDDNNDSDLISKVADGGLYADKYDENGNKLNDTKAEPVDDPNKEQGDDAVDGADKKQGDDTVDNPDKKKDDDSVDDPDKEKGDGDKEKSEKITDYKSLNGHDMDALFADKDKNEYIKGLYTELDALNNNFPNDKNYDKQRLRIVNEANDYNNTVKYIKDNDDIPKKEKEEILKNFKSDAEALSVEDIVYNDDSATVNKPADHAKNCIAAYSLTHGSEAPKLNATQELLLKSDQQPVYDPDKAYEAAKEALEENKGDADTYNKWKDKWEDATNDIKEKLNGDYSMETLKKTPYTGSGYSDEEIETFGQIMDEYNKYMEKNNGKAPEVGTQEADLISDAEKWITKFHKAPQETPQAQPNSPFALQRTPVNSSAWLTLQPMGPKISNVGILLEKIKDLNGK